MRLASEQRKNTTIELCRSRAGSTNRQQSAEAALQLAKNRPNQPRMRNGLGVYRMMLSGGDACAIGMVSTIARTIRNSRILQLLDATLREFGLHRLIE
jgi:hypothetical protein